MCRPLVVGDRVTLAGGLQLTGIVEQIDFTRTIIRNDVDIPVSVPNKASPCIASPAGPLLPLPIQLSPCASGIYAAGHWCMSLALPLRSDSLLMLSMQAQLVAVKQNLWCLRHVYPLVVITQLLKRSTEKQ